MTTALNDKLAQLKLDFMARELDSALNDAAARNLSPADTLEWLADLNWMAGEAVPLNVDSVCPGCRCGKESNLSALIIINPGSR